MVRLARRLSDTGIYHAIFRGVSRYNIFEEDKDYEKMMSIILNLKESMKFEIYAYCFMSNHVHLIVKESELGEISLIMKRLLTSYAGWFNKKYGRSGILIANRFKSEPVETDEYLLVLSRYIHQNPIKAGFCNKAENYKWSSFKEYFQKSEIVDTYMLLSIMDKENFIKYNNEIEYEEYEISCTNLKVDDEYIRVRIKEIIGGKEPFELGKFPKEERNKIILYLRYNEKFSVRQIERATGISRGVVSRCKCDN